MIARLRSWSEKVGKHPLVIGLIALIAVSMLIFLGYRLDWHWTGFSNKTLWDWLNLLGVLAIPAVVGLGAAWYTAQQGKVSVRENTDNQRETALQTYIDKISELLLNEHLGCELTSEGKLTPKEEEVRKIARVRTLTILPRLDADRKRSVLQFLHESGLLDKDKPVIDLHGANLTDARLFLLDFTGTNLDGADFAGAHFGPTASFVGASLRKTSFMGASLEQANLHNTDCTIASFSGADLRAANLSDACFSGARFTIANLYKANLTNADLRKTVLWQTNLTNADLTNADFGGADLRGVIGMTIEELEKQAKSLKGATMPDGSKHP